MISESELEIVSEKLEINSVYVSQHRTQPDKGVLNPNQNWLNIWKNPKFLYPKSQNQNIFA